MAGFEGVRASAVENLEAMIAVAVLLSWKPLTRIFPSESGLAFALVTLTMLALFFTGKLE